MKGKFGFGVQGVCRWPMSHFITGVAHWCRHLRGENGFQGYFFSFPGAVGSPDTQLGSHSDYLADDDQSISP